MKTYIINMAKDVAKREQILSQLKDFPKGDVEIFEACEGRKLTDPELQYFGYLKFKQKYGAFGTLPAFGCSISHFSVYKKVAAGNDAALILEDDAILSDNLYAKLPALHEYINSLHTAAIILLTPEFLYNKKDLFTISNNPSIQVTKVKGGCMTTGYIVNTEAAKLLSSKLFPIRYLADEWGEFIKMGLSLYGVVPHFVSYSGEFGEIGMSQIGQNKNILTTIHFFLGGIKAKAVHMLQSLKGYRISKRLW